MSYYLYLPWHIGLASGILAVRSEMVLKPKSGQRKILMREILFFLKMSEREQKVQYVPSVEEYWRCRMGTSAVGVCAAVLE